MSSVDVALPPTSAISSKENVISEDASALTPKGAVSKPASPAPAQTSSTATPSNEDTTPAAAVALGVTPTAVESSAQPTSDAIDGQEQKLQDSAAPPPSQAAAPTGTSPSGTPPLPPAGPVCIPTDTDQTPPTDQGALQEDYNTNIENAPEVVVDEASEIASDVQERSELSDLDSNPLNFGDEDAQAPVQTSAVEGGSAEPDNQDVVQPRDSVAQSASTSPARLPTAQGETLNGDRSMADNKAPAVASAVDPQSAEVPDPTIEKANATLASTEPAVQEGEPSSKDVSYTSPDHEWARILQRRLGKGLTDAQLLARSNSMLASPSILAQSLIQVIPSLQVKDSTASPGSSNREYQTAEELFDRPALIEPSAHPFSYDDQPKDEAFPSSAIMNGSQAQLLLFAPLDPGQLYGKSKSKSQPTAPSPVDAPSSKHSQSTPTHPQPQPHQQQPISALATTAQQPVQVAPPPIPIPLPPIAGAPSPASRTHVVSPTGLEVRQSPLLSREQIGAKNARQSLILLAPGHEERSGLVPHGASSSKGLLAQGSSSSLSGTPAVHKDHHVIGTPNNPIAPIQYTPVTQYKANPSKEGSKHNKKARDMTVPTIKDVNVFVASPVQLKASAETKDSVTPGPPGLLSSEAEAAPTATTNVDPVSASMSSLPETSASEAATGELILEEKPTSGHPGDGTAQWALEALSGLSNVEFDATLPVCAAVVTTLATSSQSKEALVKEPLGLPPISIRSRSNTSTTEASPKVPKMIPSPFEATQSAHEV